MEATVLGKEKGEVNIEMDNATIAEIIRVYLYKEGVEFAAWRREHPSKPVHLKVKGSEKIIKDAISAINKDCEKLLTALKK